jgi:AraC-like DNA-binding protein
VQLSLLERNGQQSLLSQREALRDRISHYIDRHLGDPDLTIDRMAQALNCSKRHLYNAVADDEETLAAMIQRRRLEACLRDLRQPAHAQRSVTDIALSWGASATAPISAGRFARMWGAAPANTGPGRLCRWCCCATSRCARTDRRLGPQACCAPCAALQAHVFEVQAASARPPSDR